MSESLWVLFEFLRHHDVWRSKRRRGRKIEIETNPMTAILRLFGIPISRRFEDANFLVSVSLIFYTLSVAGGCSLAFLKNK